LCAAIELRHFNAQSIEDARKFGSDIPAADNQHLFGHLRKREYFIRRDRHVRACDLWLGRMAACRHENVLCADLFASR
jgi:hypothetical protein